MRSACWGWSVQARRGVSRCKGVYYEKRLIGEEESLTLRSQEASGHHVR